jgi:hypothetical protein
MRAFIVQLRHMLEESILGARAVWHAAVCGARRCVGVLKNQHFYLVLVYLVAFVLLLGLL